jgi:YSIRK-targeted surface antigen transcriptional regulator
VRLYKGRQLVRLFSVVELLRDPATLHTDKLLSTENNIEYFFIDSSEVYGVIRRKTTRVVIGPVGTFLTDTAKIEKTAFLLGLDNASDIQTFVSSLALIPNMPLSGFLQMLCTVNFYLNDEMLSIKDITISESIQDALTSSIQQNHVSEQEGKSDKATPHNFLAFERTMLHLVEKGRPDELVRFFSEVTPGTTGRVATDHLRNIKNLFITTATLVSRAAIAGGLNQDEAFTMSDNYIQQAEILANTDAVLNLQYHMVLKYAERVSELKDDKSLSKLVAEAIKYIKKNIIHIESTEDIAAAVHTSRSHLGNLFKKETGKSIAEYVTYEKIEEAKRLLKYTDKPLVSISNYLGFSSQSHFQNTFKKYVNLTPKECRNGATTRIIN